MGRFKGLSKLLGKVKKGLTRDEALDVLDEVYTVDRMDKLTPDERELYLQALDVVQGPRASRMADEGYDTKMLHSTNTEKIAENTPFSTEDLSSDNFLMNRDSRAMKEGLKEFKPGDRHHAVGSAEGIYSTPAKYKAEEYLGKADSGEQMYPLMVRGQKHYDMSGQTMTDFPRQYNVPSEDESLKVLAEASGKSPEKLMKMRRDYPNEFIDLLKKSGFEGVKVGSEFKTFDPKNLRSPNAAFDKRFKDSKNLLASAAGLGAAGLVTAAPEDAEAGMFKNLFKKGAKSFEKPHTLMSAENPYHAAKTQMSNEELMKLLQGYDMDVMPTKGKYGAEEGSLMIKNPTPEQREYLDMVGKTLGQDSVIHSTGKEHQMKYLHGDKAGQYNPGKGSEVHPELPEDFYTQTPEGDIFTHNFDFDTVVDPAAERKKKMAKALGLGAAAGVMLAPEEAEGAGVQTIMKKLGIGREAAEAIKRQGHMPRRSPIDKRIEAMERVREHLKSPAPPLMDPVKGRQAAGMERKIFDLDDERVLKESSPGHQMFVTRPFESGISSGALKELGVGPETITINLPKDYKSPAGYGDIPKQYQIQEKVPKHMNEVVSATDRLDELDTLEDMYTDLGEQYGLGIRDIHNENVRYTDKLQPQIIDAGLFRVKSGEMDKDLFEKAMESISATPEEKELYRRYALGDEAFEGVEHFSEAKLIDENMKMRGRGASPTVSNTAPGRSQYPPNLPSPKGPGTATLDKQIQEQNYLRDKGLLPTEHTPPEASWNTANATASEFIPNQKEGGVKDIVRRINQLQAAKKAGIPVDAEDLRIAEQAIAEASPGRPLQNIEPDEVIQKLKEMRANVVNPELSAPDKTSTFDRLLQKQIDEVNKPKNTWDEMGQEQAGLGRSTKAGLTGSRKALTAGGMLGQGGRDLMRAYEGITEPVIEAGKEYVMDPIVEKTYLGSMPERSRTPEARKDAEEISQFMSENLFDPTNLIPGVGGGKAAAAGAGMAMTGKRFGKLAGKEAKSAAQALKEAKHSPFGRTAVIDTEAPIGKVDVMPSREEDDEVIKLLEMLNQGR